MCTRLDAQLERRQRVRKHVGILAGQRGELGGIAVVRGQRKCRTVGGERDLADEQPRAVGERRAGVGEAGQDVLSPCGRGHRCEHGNGRPAPRRRAQRVGRPSVGTSPRPTVPSSARASAGERRVAGEAGASPRARSQS